MTLIDKLEYQISIFTDWKNNTYEEEVCEYCEYSIDLLIDIISELDLLNDIISELNKLNVVDKNEN